jgi:hypothetical protein
MEISDQDLLFIETHRDSKDISKATLKKIQKIWNQLADKDDNYCMCSFVERRKYKQKFYEWYGTL